MNIQGAQIHVREQGEGEPMLLLHGSPDTGEMWNGLIRALGGGFRFIVPDLPGFGQSTAPAGFDLSLENMARFIDELVVALGVREPLHLVVHDFGGHYGLAWASKYPHKVRSLTISNTSFSTDYRWHQNAQMMRVPVLGEVMNRFAPPSMVIKTMQAASPGLKADYLKRVYDQSFARESVRRMMLRLYRERNPQVDFAGWQDDLRALAARVPSLVVWGDLDPFAPTKTAESFGAQRVAHFAQYGHWVFVEAPDVVARTMREMLAVGV